jgi:PAS domain S-box-containing protein
MTTLTQHVLGRHHPALTLDDLQRTGHVVFASVFLAIAGLAVFAAVLVSEPPSIVLVFPLAATGLLAANLWALRRSGRLDPAARRVCLIALAVAIATAWSGEGLSSDGFVWSLVICASAARLVDPRFALWCGALVILDTAALYGATVGGVLRAPVYAGELATNSVLAIAFITGIGSYQERSRRLALAARDALLRSIEESQQARLALVENVDAAIFSVDRDLRLIAGNSIFTRYSQSPGSPVLAPGQPVLAAIAASQQAEMRALFDRALAGDKFAVEHTLTLPGGAIPCEMRFNPIRTVAGSVRAVTVYARDIAERQRARAALARAHRELSTAARLAGKAEVATDLLHNVGNTLATLTGSANVIRDNLGEPAASLLREIIGLIPAGEREQEVFYTSPQGHRLRAVLVTLADTLEQERASISDELKAFDQQLGHVASAIARQQAHAHAQRALEVVELEHVIAESIEPLAAHFASARVDLETEVASLPTVMLERHRVVDILTNLLANALEAVEVGGARKQVRVSASCNARGMLQIDIADTGCGVPAEHHEALFRYGFTTKPGGEGHGLAASLLSARAMGGTVRCASAGRGAGATFSLELPFHPVARDRDRYKEEAA